MSTVIGLGVQFTANANGMTKGLSEAERAIKSLANTAASSVRLFDDLAGSSAAAAKAQQQVATDVAFLSSAFRTGQIGPEEYAKTLRELATSARQTANAFAEGARINEQYATDEEGRISRLQRLQQLLELGAVNEGAYARAKADADGSNAKAAQAEEQLAKARQRAAQIIEQNLSPFQGWQQKVAELKSLTKQGVLPQEEYNKAVGSATREFLKASQAAKQYASATASSGKGNSLAFNELSGILSALPGSIGNVAGRLSGLASAGEGLGRVFGGGLSSGFSALASSATGLLNPMTLAVGGIAAFGAAATGVTRTLLDLASSVDSLSLEAERLGVSFEFVQVLNEAAIRSGTSIEALGGGLQKFAATIQEARSGTGAAAEAFARLGISQEQLASSDITQTAIQTAQAIQQIEDPAARAAAQMDIFGKSGEQLRRALAGIPASAAAMERFGASISALDADRVLDFNSATQDLQVAVSGLGQNVALPFANLASGVTQALAEVIGGISSIVGPIGTALAPLLDIVGLVAETFGQAIGGVLQFIGSALQPLVQWAERASKAIGSVRDFLRGTREESGRSVNTGSAATAQIQQPKMAVEEINKEINRGREALDRAIASSGEYGQAGFNAALRFQEGLEDLDEQLKANEITSEQYGRGIKNLQTAFDQEIAKAKEAARAEEERVKAIERAIEADRRLADQSIENLRVETEFGGDRERFAATETAAAIQRELVRVEEEIAAARAKGDRDAADAATRRLSQLDQALAREQDIASGARKAAEERLKLEEQYAKARQAFDERRLAALARPSTELLNLEDTRTASGYAALQRFSQDQSDDPAIEEYRKQLKELQAIRKKIADIGQADTVDILGG